jgi:hypothetical protein
MVTGTDIDGVSAGGYGLPGETPARLYAAGNTAYAAGDLARAGHLYRRVLALDAGHVAARNNLAALLIDLDQRQT